jgi:tripartite-type tricarboxylate transporter receptor subunit TctC
MPSAGTHLSTSIIKARQALVSAPAQLLWEGTMKASLLKSETPRRRSAPRGNERWLVTQHPRRRILSLAAGAAALPAVSRIAWAQAYPSRPVRMIDVGGAGSGSDILGRLISQWLSERLGQPFIVENRPGGAGNIGTEAVVRASPDGYSLLLVSPANMSNATLYEKLNFNFITDIAPIASFVRVPYFMLVNPSVPPKTVPELIAYAKANPGKLNMASNGNGTPPHLNGELFKMMTGIDMIHVPYRGATAPALTDLLGGHVQVMFANMPASIAYVRAGSLRALAITSRTRFDALPDIPAVGEFVPGYEATSVYGLGGPKNMPAAIVERLNKEVNAGLADPKIKGRVADLGGSAPLTGTPAEFGKLIADETEKWGKVIRAANIKAE